MLARVRVDTMTEAEIRERLSKIDPALDIQDVSGAPSSARRKAQSMEPFTYFVVVFTAHLAAGMAHELILRQIKQKFADKNVKVEALQSKD